MNSTIIEKCVNIVSMMKKVFPKYVTMFTYVENIVLMDKKKFNEVLANFYNEPIGTDKFRHLTETLSDQYVKYILISLYDSMSEHGYNWRNKYISNYQALLIKNLNFVKQLRTKPELKYKAFDTIMIQEIDKNIKSLVQWRQNTGVDQYGLHPYYGRR